MLAYYEIYQNNPSAFRRELKLLVEPERGIYFIGIGGTGMSSIAQVLLSCNYKIRGSDIQENEAIKRLREKGAIVNIGHYAENITEDIEVVVISSAIPNNNPELTMARSKGIKILQRAEMLDYLMKEKESIAISGAHGKTTTTSMVAFVLEKIGTDPTVLIGGELNDIGGNAKVGKGRYLVAEADESDGSFLKLHPDHGIITNIDNDHLDYYITMDNMVNSFRIFINGVNSRGIVALNSDNQYLEEIAKGINNSRLITYSIDKHADMIGREIEFQEGVSSFKCLYKEKELGRVYLKVPGIQNVYNALGTIALLMELGFSFGEVKEAIAMFRGVQRRFQILYNHQDSYVVDDYGHHPTEIMATLKGAKNYNPSRLRVIFQPHRYTRTQILIDQFGNVFNDLDEVIITDIYSAGERAIPGVTAKKLIDKIPGSVKYFDDLDILTDYLHSTFKKGDMIITMGAGDIWKVSHKLAALLT